MNTHIAFLRNLSLEPISSAALPSQHAVTAAEQRLNFRFPEEFKELLSQVGPSLFTEDIGFQPCEPSPWTSDGMNTIDVFYGVSEDKAYDIVQVNQRLRGDIPVGTLAIGHDSGSNLILLTESGQVSFFDKETGLTYECAPTFSKFLKSFRRRNK